MKIVPTRAFMDCQHRTEKKLFFCPQIRVLDLTKKGEEKKKHNNPTLQYGLKNGQFFYVKPALFFFTRGDISLLTHTIT